MSRVELEAISAARRPAFDAMFQLYIHDFSEFWAGQDRGELPESGRFDTYSELDLYWTEPHRSAWFIRADSHLAGFALVNNHSHSGLPADHDVAEFFVVRKHRRSGIGFDAARQLIAGRPGQWEIAVVRANVAALGFWRRVAGSVSPEADELNLDDARWNGAILRFKVA
ncbi:GNAT family N-acetyltransferase [Phenylobacterium sp.]|jgi:predicted acetyltransferase|uniref:GNAT family N-acetyltransferase n=1 Tax=Phenylobacterium sp. TaxID=1871053 RepID=UPI0037C9F179